MPRLSLSMSIYLLLFLYLVEWWTGGAADHTVSSPPHVDLSAGVGVPSEGGLVNLTSSLGQPSVPTKTSGKISARKGVVFVPDSSPRSSPQPSTGPQSSSAKPQSSTLGPQSSSAKPQSSSSKPQSSSSKPQSSTPRPQAGSTGTRRHKPKFAMTRGEEEEGRRGRAGVVAGAATDQDYVVPVALGLVGLPLLLLLLKVLYQRGSDFTQRRRYDRMYLIDGMYNAS